jgi:hypothetical protein
MIVFQHVALRAQPSSTNIRDNCFMGSLHFNAAGGLRSKMFEVPDDVVVRLVAPYIDGA